MPGIWAPTGGPTLGTAMGAILIDTSGVERAGQVTKASVSQMTSAFREVDRQAKGMRGSFTALARDINSVRGELVGMSIAAGAIVAVGMKSAASIQAATIQFKGMTGSAKEGVALMADLRKKAAAAGVPFGDMLKASKLLLPTLNKNTDELERYLKIARRVAVLNPAEGITGAAFAINEAISSGGTDLVSLAERFQISRVQLREALKQTGGDFVAALDMVLNKMGITQATADEMGSTFDAALMRAKDSATQLIGAGMTPLLNALTPVLDKAAALFATLQDTNPELATLASGAALFVAAAGPMLLMVGQLITSFEKLQKIKMAGTLGKAGGAGLAAYAGGEIGLGAVRMYGEATGQEELATAGWGDVIQVLKEMMLVVQEVILSIVTATKPLVAEIQKALATFLQSLAMTIEAMASMVEKLFPEKGKEMTEAARSVAAFADQMMESTEAVGMGIDVYVRSEREKLAKLLWPEYFEKPQAEAAGGGLPLGGDTEQFTQEQLDAWLDFQDDLAEIEANAQERRLDLAERFEDAKQSIEEQRQKARERLQKNIDDANEDFARQQQKRTRDHNEWRAEAISDYRQQEMERLQDFNRQREREEEDHQNKLLDAAARLDAVAVIQEMQRFQEQQIQEAQDFANQKARRAKEFRERLAEAKAAHEQELEEARQAHERRLEDLHERFEEEDKAALERLQKLKEDYNKELAALNSRLQKEKQMRERAFVEQFNALAGSLNNQINIARAGQATMEADLRAWWDRMQKLIEEVEEQAAAGTQTWNGSDLGGYIPPSYAGHPLMQSGGPVLGTGLHYLHKGEEVLRPDIASMLRRAMGGSINQAALVSGAADGSRGPVTISAPITIPTHPGQQPIEIAQEVVFQLKRVLKDYVEQ